MELLAFGEDWGRHPSSSQHILSALSDSYEITWVNSIGLRQPRLNGRDINRVKEKLQSAFCFPAPGAAINSAETPGLNKAPATIIKPLVWPLARNPLLRSINRFLLSRQLPAKRQSRIIWAALPCAVDYLAICDSDLVIYYCGDDFSALAGVDHHYVVQAEKRLIERADIILACSPALHRKFPAEKTWLLPHGVSLLQFAKPGSCPADIDPLTPSVGFYGSLNNWLDQELLTQLASARPAINFYLLGPVDCDITLLEQKHNIHLLPPRPHHQLSGYLQHWTMAILPFRGNKQIQACNPLKLREYLAGGCPVISTDFPAVKPYQPLIRTAAGVKEWLAAIDDYCRFTPAQRQSYTHQARQRIAPENWESRASVVNTLINELMYKNEYLK